FQYYAWGITGNIIAALGVFGNLLSIVVLANPRMTSSTSYYLIMLSIFDSIVLISLVLFMALPIIYFATGQLEGYYRIYPYLHPYAYPTALIAQTCSIYLTVGFTVERFIAVCHPLRATEMCNTSRAKKSILTIFLCSIIYNIPRMLEYRVVVTRNVLTNVTEAMYVQTQLGANPMFRHVYFIYMHMCVMLIIPFLLLAVLNLQLCRAVKRSQNIAGKVTNSQRRENNLTMMVISVVAVFLICQVPSIIDNIFMATLPSDVLNTPPFVKLTCISSLMVITNSAVNFVLYCVFGQKFRGVFVHIFCRR
ncbi:FMRFamide receptor, partial [Lamellibrachia satsuma]